METTSITVSTTIFQPRHAILTRAVFPRMDQEIKVFSFVPILNSGVQATVEMKDFGVQVNLPLLTAEDLKGDDLKTRFYTGFVNFGTFMVIFNSLSLITGKLNYWNGKDSLKEKEYLENDVKQKPDPQRKMRLLDEFLLVFMRLCLGLLEQDLAQRFCVSVSTVSRVLITLYNVLAANLKHLIVWPSKEVIATNMPD